MTHIDHLTLGRNMETFYLVTNTSSHAKYRYKSMAPFDSTLKLDRDNIWGLKYVWLLVLKALYFWYVQCCHGKNVIGVMSRYEKSVTV